MVDEGQLLQAMQADPDDDTLRQVFADWLEGRGDPRGELLRLTDCLRTIDVSRRADLESRLRHLLYRDRVQPFRLFLNESLGIPMVWIPGGSLTMGSPQGEPGRRLDEEPVDVELSQGFYLGIVPVTQSQYHQVMGLTPVLGDSPANPTKAPVVRVRWHDALEFCRVVTQEVSSKSANPQRATWRFTLPSEAQWEYACRAGTTTPYHFGNRDLAELTDWVWCHGYYPREVASHPPNAFGLYDMHGNIWEWCLDSYQGQLPGGRDPLVSTSMQDRWVIRGGSWAHGLDRARSASRGTLAEASIEANRLSQRQEEARCSFVGFRVACVRASQ